VGRGGGGGAGARGGLAEGEREEGSHRLLVHLAAVRHGHTLAAGEVGLGVVAAQGFPCGSVGSVCRVREGRCGPSETGRIASVPAPKAPNPINNGFRLSAIQSTVLA
jgi:hypothetical protein